MSTIYVRVYNNSGRSIDALCLYHSSSKPELGIWPMEVFKASDIADGATFPADSAATLEVSASAQDYWVCGIQFQGDGETYIMSGYTGAPFKEFVIGDNNGFNIIVNEYLTDSANQSDLDLKELNGDETNTGSAFLWNSTTSELVTVGKFVAEVGARLALARR